MERTGVEVRLETAASLDAIKALKPDAVVVATGSTPRTPHDVKGLDLPHVHQAWDVLAGKVQTGERVAIVSQEDYYETPCVAEYLAEKGKHVEIAHLQFHGLRRTAAAKRAEAGCSVHEIAAITGHTTLSMLTLYTAQAEQKTRAGAAILKWEARK